MTNRHTKQQPIAQPTTRTDRRAHRSFTFNNTILAVEPVSLEFRGELSIYIPTETSYNNTTCVLSKF